MTRNLPFHRLSETILKRGNSDFSFSMLDDDRACRKCINAADTSYISMFKWKKYKLSHLRASVCPFPLQRRKKVQSFTISARQSGNSTIRWTWYNFKYDTLFVTNWRKQISIDVQSFIICLQIIVSSWCRFRLWFSVSGISGIVWFGLETSHSIRLCPDSTKIFRFSRTSLSARDRDGI